LLFLPPVVLVKPNGITTIIGAIFLSA